MVWLGPTLEVSHYRTLFYGYDTVLKKAKITGLEIRLASQTEEYEHINLPADYIQGFLLRVP